MKHLRILIAMIALLAIFPMPRPIATASSATGAAACATGRGMFLRAWADDSSGTLVREVYDVGKVHLLASYADGTSSCYDGGGSLEALPHVAVQGGYLVYAATEASGPVTVINLAQRARRQLPVSGDVLAVGIGSNDARGWNILVLERAPNGDASVVRAWPSGASSRTQILGPYGLDGDLRLSERSNTVYIYSELEGSQAQILALGGASARLVPAGFTSPVAVGEDLIGGPASRLQLTAPAESGATAAFAVRTPQGATLTFAGPGRSRVAVDATLGQYWAYYVRDLIAGDRVLIVDTTRCTQSSDGVDACRTLKTIPTGDILPRPLRGTGLSLVPLQLVADPGWGERGAFVLSVESLRGAQAGPIIVARIPIGAGALRAISAVGLTNPQVTVANTGTIVLTGQDSPGVYSPDLMHYTSWAVLADK